MKIVMLGAPGAGKGTQADKLAQHFGIPHISTGDIFRSNLKQGTPLGLKAKSYMDAGQLVPDDLTCDLIKDRLLNKDCAKGYILDGFPRTLSQAEVLKARGEVIDIACSVDVPDESIVTRMSGRRACPSCGATYHLKYKPPKVEGVCDACKATLIQRDDDKPETVLKRLSVYHKETEPLINYYKKEGILSSVDGTQDIDKVFSDIKDACEKVGGK